MHDPVPHTVEAASPAYALRNRVGVLPILISGARKICAPPAHANHAISCCLARPRCCRLDRLDEQPRDVQHVAAAATRRARPAVQRYEPAVCVADGDV